MTDPFATSATAPCGAPLGRSRHGKRGDPCRTKGEARYGGRCAFHKGVAPVVSEPRIVPDPRVDPVDVDRAERERRSGKQARATKNRKMVFGGGFKTEAEWRAEAARAVKNPCRVRGCGQLASDLRDGLCPGHARAGLSRASMDELGPSRVGACNAPIGRGKGGGATQRPSGSRCRMTRLDDHGRCCYHRGVVLAEEAGR